MIVAWRHESSLAFQARLAEKARGLAPEMRQILLRTHEIGAAVSRRRSVAGDERQGLVRALHANDA